jgi:hypothetical protein
MKPIPKGVLTRDGLPPAGSRIRVATINVRWFQIEPTRDSMIAAPIESVLGAAEEHGLEGVRLRVMLGSSSPDWAKQIANGPVTYEHIHGGVQLVSIPDIWSPEWQTEAAELFAWIASRYDADPRLRLIFATGGMTLYGEPFQRAFAGSALNRANLPAAGYSDSSDAALQKSQLDWMRPFVRTPVGLAYNPWQYLGRDGEPRSSSSFMAEVMDYHLALFGERTVLQNNSIRSSFIGSVPPYYAEFLRRLGAPGSTQYQAAAAVRIGDARATIEWAIEYLCADGLELPDGYADVLTTAQLADYDVRLKANQG